MNVNLLTASFLRILFTKVVRIKGNNMRKLCVGLFSSFVILLSLYGIVYPSYYFGLALSFTKPYLLALIILITALVAYTFFTFPSFSADTKDN